MLKVLFINLIGLEDTKELELRIEKHDDLIEEDKDSSAVTGNALIENAENLNGTDNAEKFMTTPNFALDTLPEDEDRLDVVTFCYFMNSNAIFLLDIVANNTLCEILDPTAY